MPALTQGDIEELFTYQPPNEDQVIKYKIIREAAKVFASTVLANTPPTPDQTTAIRKIREAVMIANASIALRGKY